MPRVSPERKAHKPAKRHRLEVRITDGQRQLFQHAAGLQGRSLTDFVIATVHEKAVQTFESMEIIRLKPKTAMSRIRAVLLGSHRDGAMPRRYLPDIIVRIDDSYANDPLNLIVEIKDEKGPITQIKAKTMGTQRGSRR
jgi:uncharacterized protein (DUF1778 family)